MCMLYLLTANKFIVQLTAIFTLMRFSSIVLTAIAVVFHSSECARILGIFPMPGISHNILTSKLMKALMDAGHDVTVISAFPVKDAPKNGTMVNIVIEGLIEKMNARFSSGSINMFALNDQNLFEMMSNLNTIFINYCNETVHHPKVQELLKSDQKFDGVILEQFMNDALKVFAHIYDCPLIILSSLGANSWVNSMVGNEAPVSYVAHIMKGDFSRDLSLFNRGFNLVYNLFDAAISKFYLLPAQDALMHEWFPDAPPLIDLYTNVSIVLLNSHTSLYPPLPLVPNMVEIGGYFIDPPGKLPADLQDILDKSPEGVIYFSMGSNLKSKELPEEKKQAIIRVLGRLKMKVLWKFEDDLPNKPNNVIIRNWFPQQDVLAHPNVRMFITHGGLLSTTETVHHGVPILAIPVFGDQNANADRAVSNGYGLKLGFVELTENKFEKLINELLINSSYTENVKQRSKIYHDRPEHPLKTAIYWIEYVIRHRGAPHLRVAGAKLPWYKYYMIDVIFVILVLIVIAIKIVKLLFKKVCTLVCRKNSKSGQKKKTN